ncbi:unnamed protein product [Prorocentrum cordatum]|uniref:Uncharacterized protein n=1 Tax=Prorocentrum cordatum TaxID=2364126 RepID=A0ABN9SEM1_9DINO|nr:unnamed protein product [Polarella glacialis]
MDDVKLAGNSLVSWPAALRNCRRVPHPMRESKPFLRDKILCKESGSQVGNVQNNLNIGPYKGKHVALFRATDTVLDCGQGTLIDFPSWKALREMLNSRVEVVDLTVDLLMALAGDAEEEVAAGLADEVKVEPPASGSGASTGAPAAKKPRLAGEPDADAWRASELGEYPGPRGSERHPPSQQRRQRQVHAVDLGDGRRERRRVRRAVGARLRRGVGQPDRPCAAGLPDFWAPGPESAPTPHLPSPPPSNSPSSPPFT